MLRSELSSIAGMPKQLGFRICVPRVSSRAHVCVIPVRMWYFAFARMSCFIVATTPAVSGSKPRLFFRCSRSAGQIMAAVRTKYALCHLCPGKWIRKDLIKKGQTAEEACGAHTDRQLAAYAAQEQAWSDQQLRKLHEAAAKAERERRRRLKRTAAKKILRKKPSGRGSIPKEEKVCKKPASAKRSNRKKPRRG